MPSMGVLLKADVKKMVLEELNLSKTAYGTFDGSPLYKGGTAEYIDDAILVADDMVVNLILMTPGHPRRIHYSTEITFSSPGEYIPLSGSSDNRGTMSVEITRHDSTKVVGKLAPAHKITEWLQSKVQFGDDDVIDGYYDITDGNLIFTGASIEIRILSTTAHASADTDLYSPPEYKGTIVRLALAEIMKKDPARRALVGDYDQEISRDMGLIAQGAELTPAFKAQDQQR